MEDKRPVKPKSKRRRPDNSKLLIYQSVNGIVSGLKPKTKRNYLMDIARFCAMVGRNPDEVIGERKKHLRSRDESVVRSYERLVLQYYELRKKTTSEASAYTATTSIRAFFSRNYVDLKFRRTDFRPAKEGCRDFVPSLNEIRDIIGVASVRDKAVFTMMLQTGVAPVDLIDFTRSDFEIAFRRAQESGFPAPFDWRQREKTRCWFRPFLMRDTALAVQVYLRTRKDSSPALFLDRSGKPLTERAINDAFCEYAEKVGTPVPNGKVLRVYCLRKFYRTASQNSGIPLLLVNVMMGHSTGIAGRYDGTSDSEWIEMVRAAEPLLSISVAESADVGKIREEVSSQVSDQLNTVTSENVKLKERLTNLEGRIRKFGLAVSTSADRYSKLELESEDEAIEETGRLIREFAGAMSLLKDNKIHQKDAEEALEKQQS